jgi:hypothetical protein
LVFMNDINEIQIWRSANYLLIFWATRFTMRIMRAGLG